MADATFQKKPPQGEYATAVRQRKAVLMDGRPSPQTGKLGDDRAVQRAPKSNNTGLPDNLKHGIESLSGMSMDNVKVHYNSSKPAQLNAHAYAQGTDIHVAPGQEKHLPHEAWHVVQQAQGRVKPTMQMKVGVPVNDDKRLEQEADVMGAKAATSKLVQKKTNKSMMTSDAVQLRKIDVVARGITHLVRLNEQGSLYQEDFMKNEVSETRAGDSVVIETDIRVRSRRGPNQEQDPSRDKNADSNHVWTNAITHNDEVLPSHTFIRDGTFDERRAPKTVFNLASGTVPETLMHTDVEQQLVVNLDSGHMAVADAVFANSSPAVIQRIAALLVEKNPKGQFGTTKALKTTEARQAVLEQQMSDKPATLMTNLKLLLHEIYPGHGGVLNFLKAMPPNIKETVDKSLSTLKSFRLGDLSTGADLAKTYGAVDVVHMVNAFGFNPINDREQVEHLATMLKRGGRLVITAEKSGPTVSPLLPEHPETMSPSVLAGHVSHILGGTDLGQFFVLGPLVYPHGMPLGAGPRSHVMPRNALTASMGSSRHTMPSANTTDMRDDFTVQITFIRK